MLELQACAHHDMEIFEFLLSKQLCDVVLHNAYEYQRVQT